MIPKFRAWRKDGKEMGKVGRIIFDLDGSISNVHFKGEFLNFDFTMNNVILMQSTGLKDKNGKEIFEGDILKFNDEWADYCHEGYIDGVIEGINYVEVVRGEACFEFGKTKLPESALFAIENEHFKFKDFIKDEGREFEIIGNIYENPELLEVE